MGVEAWRLDASEGDFQRGFGRRHFKTGTHGSGQGARHENDFAGAAMVTPRDPYAFAEKERAQEAEAVGEIDDLGFALVELKVALGEQGFGLEEGLLGLFGGFGEDHEIVGITDKFAAGFFEFAVEVFEKEIGEQW